MLSPDQAQRLGQKYMERRAPITNAMIARHLDGTITLAAPAAVDQRAHVLPLDIDAGGMAAIRALLAASSGQELWAIGQYCRRPDLPDNDQRGYVWLPFDTLVDTARLQTLGTQLIAAICQPKWNIKARAFHAVTRLPLARHQYIGYFGDLVLADRLIAIDQNPASALDELHHAYRENSSAILPERSLPPQPLPRFATQRTGAGITITRYNEAHDVEELIRCYGARSARRRGLYFCPFHSDKHASLAIYSVHGRRYCHCFSRHSDCPLDKHARNDAFNVYCIGEGIDAKAALRRLNGRV